MFIHFLNLYNKTQVSIVNKSVMPLFQKTIFLTQGLMKLVLVRFSEKRISVKKNYFRIKHIGSKYKTNLPKDHVKIVLKL